MKEYKFKIFKESNMVCNDSLSVKINGMQGSTPVSILSGFGFDKEQDEISIFATDVGTVASIILLKEKNEFACTLKYVELT